MKTKRYLRDLSIESLEINQTQAVYTAQVTNSIVIHKGIYHTI